MMEMNFELVAVDDLLRGPGDWDAGTRGRHNHQVAIVPALQKSDVAIMRQNFWPQLQVGRCFEDHHLRRLHEDRVYSVHGMASVRWKPARPAMLRNFRGTMDSSPKSIFVKEKNRRLPHPDMLSPTERLSGRIRVRPLADFRSLR